MISRQRQLLKNINQWSVIVKSMASSCQPETSHVEKEVLFECKNNRGIITLNKPKALNALNYPMVCRIVEKLKEWESYIDMVIIRGNERAFCAGGDIVDITREGPGNACKGKLFFKHEYFMNNLIGTYKKPYIAIIEGITMGGGLGLSVHGRYRIAATNTMSAMPETAIGLFPDVGGTYFLSRLSGGLGMYLALTGQRLKGADVVKAGIATHYCPSESLPALMDGLVNKIDPCNIENELSAYTKDISSFQFSLASKTSLIDRIFSLCTIEEILEALEKEGSDFCLKTLAELKQKSPTSLKLSMKGLQLAKHLTLQESLQMEYRMSCAVLDAKVSKDFYEGVRALLIDKDKKPQWCPKLEELTDEMIELFFEPLDPDAELKL